MGESICTKAIHGNLSKKAYNHGAVVTPIYQSANFLWNDEQAKYSSVKYIRNGNTPSHEILHEKLALLENAEGNRLQGIEFIYYLSSIGPSFCFHFLTLARSH
jgi:cystathionine beta-lyase/cystathionine gamma-synthase